jgi:hypothetical protein
MTRFLATTAAAARRAAGAAVAVAALALAGCELDLENPNDPTEEEVVANADGLIAVAVGMQGQFSQTIDDYVTVDALVTDELGTRSLALLSYISLYTGQNFDPSYDVILTPYARSFQVLRSANTVLEGAEQVELGRGTTAGVTSLARLYKAMTLGMLIQQFEQVPTTPGSAPTPRPRAEVLDTILTNLEQARAALTGVTDAELADFRNRVLGNSGFDLRNTIDAMLARYYLMAGRHADAVTAADRVNLGVLSVLAYPTPTRNPLENLAYQLRYVAVPRSFVRGAQAGDRRPSYWVDTAAAPLPANPTDSILLPLRKYSTPTEPFPIYLPDEIRLIKAEALARQGQFAAAAALVNAVRTQTTSAVDEPVAGLPALPLTALDTEAELLAEIAYERRYELFLQGLRWEDTRRLGTVRTTTPTFPYLPLPQRECLTNPSVTCS